MVDQRIDDTINSVLASEGKSIDQLDEVELMMIDEIKSRIGEKIIKIDNGLKLLYENRDKLNGAISVNDLLPEGIDDLPKDKDELELLIEQMKEEAYKALEFMAKMAIA